VQDVDVLLDGTLQGEHADEWLPVRRLFVVRRVAWPAAGNAVRCCCLCHHASAGVFVLHGVAKAWSDGGLVVFNRRFTCNRGTESR
jgi:hypothetical protein